MPADENGLRPALLREALQRSGARLVYCQPLYANPHGTVLAEERRPAVLEAVADAGAFLIEDDWARDLVLDGPAPRPLAADDRDGHVVYVRSLTKIAAPGLRVARWWPVARRSPGCARRAWWTTCTARACCTRPRSAWSARRPSPVTCAGCRPSCASGATSSCPARRPLSDAPRPPRAPRRPARVGRPAAGSDDEQVAAEALRAGVLVGAGTPYYPAEAARPGLRLSFAGAGADDLRDGVRRLAGARAAMTRSAVDLLGWITDRFTPPPQVVTRLDGARLVRSPDLPDYWFGTTSSSTPSRRRPELQRWIERWSEIIGEPLPRRRIISWERPELHLSARAEGGRRAARHGRRDRRDPGASESSPAAAPTASPARVCESDADWEAALAVGAADAPDQADFQRRLARHHRARAATGYGEWWIGEVDGQVVATAGIYWNDEGTIARYQRVDTREEARRRGYASALLTAMALHVRERLPDLGQIVIVAEVGEAGERVYRRLGFEPASYGPSLVGLPPTG